MSLIVIVTSDSTHAINFHLNIKRKIEVEWQYVFTYDTLMAGNRKNEVDEL